MTNFINQIKKKRMKRYKTAREVIKHLTDILIGKYHIKKVVLIGSSLKENSFHFHSDIDLCVEGLPDNLYFQAVGELLIEAGEFDVDLIPIEDATERMREYIKKGEILYEER